MNENRIAKILFMIGAAQIGAGVIIGLLLIMDWSELDDVFSFTLGGFVCGMLLSDLPRIFACSKTFMIC